MLHALQANTARDPPVLRVLLEDTKQRHQVQLRVPSAQRVSLDLPIRLVPVQLLRTGRVQHVRHVPLGLGEVLPVRQQQIQDVLPVSQDLPLVRQRMRQPVQPVLLPVWQDLPIRPRRVQLLRTGCVQHVLYVPLGLGEVRLVQPQQIQGVRRVSLDPRIVQRRMLRPVPPVQLPVSLDQPISPLLVQ